MTAQRSFFDRKGRVKHEADKPKWQRDIEADNRRLHVASKKEREEYRELTAPIPEWPSLVAAVRAMTLTTGGDFIRWLREQHWLADVHYKARHFALRIIDKRCNEIIIATGREPLDDAIDKPTVYFEAQKILRGFGLK